MSDFDASVIYGIVAKPKLIEKLRNRAILTTKWYDDDDLYQIADWLGKKYKSKLKRKRYLSPLPLGFPILKTEFLDFAYAEPVCRKRVFLNVIILSI